MKRVAADSDLLHADWDIRLVDYLHVKRFIYHHHYARIMPSTGVSVKARVVVASDRRFQPALL